MICFLAFVKAVPTLYDSAAHAFVRIEHPP